MAKIKFIGSEDSLLVKQSIEYIKDYILEHKTNMVRLHKLEYCNDGVIETPIYVFVNNITYME